ncbi:Polyketide synthase [Pseudomonas orientalis]|uniref:beta-ketoacyl synthase N-terminal-like domain-containing protein n=1 Tax=Pseudomonas orientalis TaxID=76758 RepID=UPI000F581E0B|nr:beta-ketoacyl synthase N-terminal-like domain-containing protein [Pseudomonas orientalis]AZE98482.1 Polyketide synthase [Pseudomonas orientalis]
MSDQAIAIIGVSCRLPQARDLRTLWQNLLAGRVCSTRYTTARLRAMGVSEALLNSSDYVPVDSCLEYADQFDPELFAISQREAELLDPQHRLLLECAWELAQQTGLGNPLHRPRIGVFAGSSMNSYLSNVIGGECDLVSPHGTELMLTNDKDYLCARISYKLGFTGPSVTVQTGCSTSLSAVHCAIQSLLLGECEVAFAGGVSVHAHSRPGYSYHPDLMFSRDGACRPFDENASGTFFGDGAGLVALRPLDDALRDGDSIQAVILGSATNNDGAARAGFSAPGVEGQRQLILEALAIAGVHPESLGMIEAHGTGTRLGDPIEFNALCQAFAAHTDRREFCALGSVKANLGHLAAAAGFAGLAKTVAALNAGRIAPHPSFSRINPALRLDSTPFIINTQPMEWPVAGIRRAGLSSFGAGGSNVHMILEQAPARVPRVAVPGWQTILLSARDVQGVEQLAHDLTEQLNAAPDTPLDEVARGFAEGRTEYPWRLAVTARNNTDLIATLQARRYAIAKITGEPGQLIIDVGPHLIKALEHEPAYQQEIGCLLEQLPGADDAPDKARIRQALVHTPDNETAFNLATLAALRCLRRLVKTPVAYLITSRMHLAVDCHEGRLSLLQLLAAVNSDACAPQAWGSGYLLRDSFQVRSGEQVLSLEPDMQDTFVPLCAHTWRSAPHQGLRGVLGELWRAGVSIDWSGLRAGVEVPHRMLPIAPMRYRRCWYKPPVAQTLPGEGNQEALVYVERWERGQRLCSMPRSETKRRFCLLGASQPEVLALGDGLRAWGHEATFAEEVDEESHKHLVWCLDDDSCNDDSPALAWQLCERVKQWSLHRDSTLALTLVGSGFADPFCEGTASPARSMALACIAAINQELPGIVVNVLDVNRQALSTPTTARDVARAVALNAGVAVLALRHGVLWSMKHRPLPPPSPVKDSRRRVCLVTGGLGSVGFGMAHYLARKYQADLILVRRPGERAENTEALYRQRLAVLRDSGVRVEVIHADVSHRESLHQPLALLGEQGLVPNCFVHAAGYSGESTVQWLNKTTRAQWEQMMAPKWDGARHLHEWFADRPLLFGCFVSSLAVLAGGLGLAPYAAANEASATWRSLASESRPYFAIDWDGWEGWEHSQGFKYGTHRARPLGLEDVDEALDVIFANYLDHTRFVVSTVPLESRLAASGDQTVAEVPAAPSVSQASIEVRMAALWREVLHCPVEDQDNFFDLGGDSLVGAGLIRSVNSHFGVKLSMVDLFESASVAALSRQVEQWQKKHQG